MGSRSPTTCSGSLPSASATSSARVSWWRSGVGTTCPDPVPGMTITSLTAGTSTSALAMAGNSWVSTTRPRAPECPSTYETSSGRQPRFIGTHTTPSLAQA